MNDKDSDKIIINFLPLKYWKEMTELAKEKNFSLDEMASELLYKQLLLQLKVSELKKAHATYQQVKDDLDNFVNAMIAGL